MAMYVILEVGKAKYSVNVSKISENYYPTAYGLAYSNVPKTHMQTLTNMFEKKRYLIIFQKISTNMHFFYTNEEYFPSTLLFHHLVY